MLSANGQLRDDELTKVADSWIDGGKGMRLAHVAARAWNAMVADARSDDVALWIAEPAGAYRSLETQRGMKNPDTSTRYGISTDSTVNIAAPGYSTHGDGMALDIGSFPPAANIGKYGLTGQIRRTWLLNNAARFGFARQFGENDPNHFRHNGTTLAGTGTTPLEEDDLTPAQAQQLQLIYDALTPGVAGVKGDGATYGQARLANIAANVVYSKVVDLAKVVQVIADTLTPGITGVKTIGDVYARVLDIQQDVAEAAGRPVTPVDVDEEALADALAARGLATKDDVAAILTAIAGVDEATLATFGLKRA